MNSLAVSIFLHAFELLLKEAALAMAARDQGRALAIHVDLLTRGSQIGDIGLWMSAIKLLVMRL